MAAYDLKEGLRELTGGRGVDVVYDCVGGDSSEAALRATAWHGRFLVVGFASGDIPKIPLNLLLLKGCEAIGVFWGEAVKRDPAGHRANMRQVLDWVAEGRLNPRIHAHLSARRDPRGNRRARPARGRRQGRADALIANSALAFRHSLPCCGDAARSSSVASVRVPMRLSRLAMLACGAIAALTSAYQPATAEGFFRKLFGWGSSRRSERIEPPTFNFGFGGQQLDYGRGYGQGYGDSGFPQDYAKYRTLCVRTCDGFYFPIGDSVGRERLYSDARDVLGALRRRGEAVLLPDQRRQRRHDGRHGRAAVRADADGVSLSQDAGAGLHVQTRAVVGGNRGTAPGLQGRGGRAGTDAQQQ